MFPPLRKQKRFKIKHLTKTTLVLFNINNLGICSHLDLAPPFLETNNLNDSLIQLDPNHVSYDNLKSQSGHYSRNGIHFNKIKDNNQVIPIINDKIPHKEHNEIHSQTGQPSNSLILKKSNTFKLKQELPQSSDFLPATQKWFNHISTDAKKHRDDIYIPHQPLLPQEDKIHTGLDSQPIKQATGTHTVHGPVKNISKNKLVLNTSSPKSNLSFETNIKQNETVKPSQHVKHSTKFVLNQENKTEPVNSSNLTTTTDQNLVGVYTVPGKKHYRSEDLNEDHGSIINIKANIQHNNQIKEHYLAQIARIFDGHGPQMIGGIQSPGKIFAHFAAKEHKKLLLDNMQQLLIAPILSRDHPDHFNYSRQALLVKTINNTQHQLNKTLGNQITVKAGATATILFASPDLKNQNMQKPIDVLCANLGDSRAIALTFDKTILRTNDGSMQTLYTPDSLCVLSNEQNIRVKAEQDIIGKKLLNNGYINVPIAPTTLSSSKKISMFPTPFPKCGSTVKNYFSTMLPSVSNIWIRPDAYNGKLSTFDIYYNQPPYFFKFIFDTKQHTVQQSGLQLTGSLGDRFLEPIKQSILSSCDVSVIKLVPNKNKFTILIAASDGLWDAVHLLDNNYALLHQFIAHYLPMLNANTDSIQTLTKDITLWAANACSDDVTVSIFSYPDKDVQPCSRHFHLKKKKYKPPLYNTDV